MPGQRRLMRIVVAVIGIVAAAVLAGVVAIVAGASVSPPRVAIRAGADGALPKRSETRLFYSSDWMGPSQIFAVDPAPSGATGQVTFGREANCSVGTAQSPCGFSQPLVAPDGRWIAYRSRAGELWIARANGSRPRRVAGAARATLQPVRWSSRSSSLEYVIRTTEGGSELRLVSADVARDRLVYRCDACWSLVRSPDERSLAFVDTRGVFVLSRGKLRRLESSSQANELSWSPDGRWIAYVGDPNWREGQWPPRSDVVIISASGRRARSNVAGPATMPTWSPDGRRLAFASREGLRVLDLSTGRTRLLTRETASQTYTLPFGFAWSPDGRSLAYIPGGRGTDVVRSGPLRITTVSGRTRTVVDADTAYGGRILSVAWSRVPAKARFRPPEPVPRVRVTSTGLLASGPVTRLAGDGGRVAFESCNKVAIWTPASAELKSTRIGRFQGQGCVEGLWGLYSLALAGDRVGYATKPGRCSMSAAVERIAGDLVELGQNQQCSPQPYTGALGYLAGAGPLLVFSRWSEAERVAGTYRTTSAQVLRAGPGGCPCPQLSSTTGPLLPADVDTNRVVAYGTNETLLLDADGRTLLSLSVSPLAAQLSADHLILVTPGLLHDHDASTGALRHSWPIANVPSGGDGGGPRYESYRLELHDVAHGLAAYVLDGNIHILRLADGADVIIGYGTSARFTGSGLVYADHARIHLVTYQQLPFSDTVVARVSRLARTDRHVGAAPAARSEPRR